MKKVLSIMFLLILSFTLSSCTVSTSFSGTRIGSVSSATDEKIYHSVMKFNGSATYTINVKKDRSLCFDGKIEVKEGTINVMVYDTSGRELYNETLKEDKDIKVEIPNYGKNKIKILAKDFHGSYLFTW